jgi:glyoxylase-like metal-dependent hydrolase (beta-lactamase superfamily II)
MDNILIKFSHTDMGNGIIAVTAPMREQIYLVIGTKSALVIDSGMGIGSLKSYLRMLCSLPFILVNTHGHPDHAGGNIEFEEVYLHENDYGLYREMVSKEYRVADVEKIFGDNSKPLVNAMLDFSDNVKPITEGDVFDLGGRKVVIYNVPGHTRGSIVLYDNLSKALFTGDACSINDTWLYLDYSTTLFEYYQALLRFQKNKPEFYQALSGHIPNIASQDILGRKIECVEAVLSGELVGEKVITFAGTGYRAEYAGNSIIYNPKRLK